MTLEQLQATVDQWIKTYGVRYFAETTNTIVLMEEVGELSRLMARVYGEQSFKKKEDELDAMKNIAEELGDILFVITCLANQMDLDLSAIMNKNLEKKTLRDHDRHHDNTKLI
jgi:NTP pyrophosphatase (non-canonical NTP hydrolase)